MLLLKTGATGDGARAGTCALTSRTGAGALGGWWSLDDDNDDDGGAFSIGTNVDGLSC